MDWIQGNQPLIAGFFSHWDELLRRVPDVVWAALIAAGVAFLTTTLSNRNSRRQLKMQLDSNALRQKEEREMALRRDVYLPAAEAITRANSLLGLLSNVDSDHLSIGRQLTANLATLSKVQLVASDATVRALMTFTKTFMPAFLEMMTLRVPLLIRKNGISLQQTFMDAALAEHRRLVLLMKEHNISGGTDRALLDRLNGQCAKEMDVFRKHAAEQAELFRLQNEGIIAIAQRLGELLGPVAATVPDAILSARRELDLPIDEAEYRRLFGEQQQAAQAALRDIKEKFGPSLGGNSQ